MARPASIKLPPRLLQGAQLGPPQPFLPPLELVEPEPVTVLHLRESRLDAAQHMPRPADGSTTGAMALLSEGTQLRLLAQQGEKKLILIAIQRDMGMAGPLAGRIMGVEMIHGDIELLPDLQRSLRQSLQSTQCRRAEITGRFTPSEEVLEENGWDFYELGPFKVHYMGAAE